MTAIPFRFGVVTTAPPRATAWTDHARAVERLGYDTLVMPDNVSRGLAVFPALAAAAAATSRLRLGTYVLANDVRHPVMVAKESLALAALSDGRFELGLGAGRPAAQADNAMLGLPFDDGAVRVSRLAESIGLIRRLLDGETVTHDGEHYAVTGATVTADGAAARPVPLMIAAGAPRMLRLAGEVADTVALAVPPDAAGEDAAAKVDRVRSAAGRHVEANVNLMAVGGQVPWFLRGRLDAEALAAAGSPAAVSGSPQEMADELRARRERWGLSYYLVSDELMDTFAPVARELAGE
ncbi:TIGR03621 family F420-dependent LLM class oxidoreductase [Myceligenerans indicum]|uniref:TIGR03621 family F420-dependent LLM class oxidoreductase n=1 Tax=Myceligenerans indicum TaxID=2593663 RepID=A0ABS1LP71_9MICO|nr:TIGR03621 family F420-dependent LLM class oxidoreductase [Myceligenerans indicum]MBL0887583.1 TIGR03621 family F420-dependent LLM class oxidoreductase [Myceligenerans indicum]